MALNSNIERLEIDLSKYELLDELQAGHLRHFHNLVSLADGEWHHMGNQESQQEFLDAFRYQLAQMSYAAGVTHYHRLPAARSVFKPLIRRLIHKMLLPQVWSYWYLTSQSGNLTDPGRTELRKPWADPVIHENIMYSGHVLLMTSLYAMLFNDDEFEQPESIRFKHEPMFWGLGPQTFTYDNRSLQKAIIGQMERNGWIGVCCEPNNVFLVCNQFPIIAMRYNEVRDGTNTVKDVLSKYKAAIEDSGMIDSDGNYCDWRFLKQQNNKTALSIGFTAWCNAYMNTWNSEYVRSVYDKQAVGHITDIDGRVRVQLPPVAWAYRAIAQASNAGPNDASVLLKAQMEARKEKPHPGHWMPPLYGYIVQWLSELGKEAELRGLLDYAHERLRPTWENGGLFYPRNDPIVNQSGEWTFMDPFTGNAAIAYARLNINDGQKIMWEKPWTSESLAANPWIDGVELGDGVDCLRAVWDHEVKALILTLRTWNKDERTVRPVARNLASGTWRVYIDGSLTQTSSVEASGFLAAEVNVAERLVDVVFVRVANTP